MANPASGSCASSIKQHGVHYTPPQLATFLARRAVRHLPETNRAIRALDPACGDGALLRALANELKATTKTTPAAGLRESASPGERLANHYAALELCGYDRDAAAIRAAEQALQPLVQNVSLRNKDFLDLDHSVETFDVVISNPPYVRTQVLGARRAQELAQRFGISGRLDLYHAFAIAMSQSLRVGGALALLTSNRFLSVQSGAALRRFLREHFRLLEIVNLGDTKLFDAAVLPAIVIAKKTDQPPPPSAACAFLQVYEERNAATVNQQTGTSADDLLDMIEDESVSGLIQSSTQTYRVDRGSLHVGEGGVWTMRTPQDVAWLDRVQQQQFAKFNDVAEIRVGIKTTADAVFIRDNWQDVDAAIRPEADLLFPLFTHRDATRWLANEETKMTVLYPHLHQDGRRAAIDLGRYPRAKSYFGEHAARLKGRKYITDSGRNWYEIWVPQRPDQWPRPKIIWPDISEQPRFCLDRSGKIVNGDCYWIVLRPGVDEAWLYLILAVANSTLVTRYYDITCQNKLYAGRRRFMTQYVKQFPLPDVNLPVCQRIVELVRRRVDGQSVRTCEIGAFERESDALVYEAFQCQPAHSSAI